METPSASRPREKDPCCVLTAELAPLVQNFVDRRSDLRSETGPRRPAAVAVIHRRTFLANRRLGIGVGKDTIRNVLMGRNRTTELWIADSLLCAIGESGALGDGRVRVLPNPTASLAARREAGRRGMPECCGSPLH